MVGCVDQWQTSYPSCTRPLFYTQNRKNKKLAVSISLPPTPPSFVTGLLLCASKCQQFPCGCLRRWIGSALFGLHTVFLVLASTEFRAFSLFQEDFSGYMTLISSTNIQSLSGLKTQFKPNITSFFFVITSFLIANRPSQVTNLNLSVRSLGFSLSFHLLVSQSLAGQRSVHTSSSPLWLGPFFFLLSLVEAQ